MPGQRVVGAVAAALAALFTVSCGPERAPKADIDEGEGGASPGGAPTAGTGATSGGMPGGGSGNTTAGGGGSGGVVGGGAGGTGGSTVIVECGNGRAELGEQCDGEDFGDYTCRSLGFDEGTLACDDCSIDFSGCSGTETCFDFRDNDGDRRVDCADSDCSEQCASPCASAPAIDDPAVITGTTEGRTVPPGLVFELTTENDGIIEADLTTSENLVVSLRRVCSDPNSEFGYAFGTSLEKPVAAGETVYVIVDGIDDATEGSFTLEVGSRTISCGDGFRDGDEACDDGNTVDGDGCSATCEVEPAETEDNGTLALADPYVELFYATIAPIGDEDWVEFSVDSAPGAVALDTFDYGDGACATKELDSYLALFDDEGALIAANDDGGPGFCASIVESDLSVGTYYVRVSASPAGTTMTFPYRLGVDVDTCGNGRQAEGEECDDGNRIDWDGCDSNCKLE